MKKNKNIKIGLLLFIGLVIFSTIVINLIKYLNDKEIENKTFVKKQKELIKAVENGEPISFIKNNSSYSEFSCSPDTVFRNGHCEAKQKENISESKNEHISEQERQMNEFTNKLINILDSMILKVVSIVILISSFIAFFTTHKAAFILQGIIIAFLINMSPVFFRGL